MITGRYITLDESRPINIHLCKDRTLSYRNRVKREPVFNDVAVPVLSVASEEEAEALIYLVGKKQYENHPHPNWKLPYWRKLFNGVGGHKPYLDPEDVPEAEDYLWKMYSKMKGKQRE